jgi:2-dehydro-3-deoxygluconokinase
VPKARPPATGGGDQAGAEDLDLVTFGEVMVLLCAEPGRPLRSAKKFDRSLAGAESNVAIGLARLGHRAGWFGRVGDDALGRGALDTLRAEGVDLSRARVDSLAPTGILVRDVHTRRRIEVVYQRRSSAGQRVSVVDVDPLYIRSARVLHVTGIKPALGPDAARAVDEAVAMATDAGVAVSFDPNLRRRLWDDENDARQVLRRLASSAHIVLAGLAEAEFVSGKLGAAAASRWFVDQGALRVAVTLGAEGAWVTDGGTELVSPGRQVQVVDPIGAGDAFAAGFLSAWLHGEDLEECAEKGNLVAALCVTALGDFEGLPTEAELGSFRAGNDEAER